MTEKSNYVRRGLSLCLLVALSLATVSLSCSDGASLEPGDEPPEDVPEDFGAGAQIMGVCFMDNEGCVSSYVDLGLYEGGNFKTQVKVPAYMFPSLGFDEGGRPHPLDPGGLYHPFRLQNNVFADIGRAWDMFAVYSGTLNLVARPQPGVVLWGVGADTTVGDPDDVKSYLGRDLFENPFTSEEGILEAEQRGEVKVVRMGLVVDCPMVPVDAEDTVVNLNPTYSLCATSVEKKKP